MTTQPHIQLNDGHDMPQLGFGVWEIDNDEVPQIVGAAIDAGFRHIDTAEGYGNEQGVGSGIAASGVAREDLFITSKLRGRDLGHDSAFGSLEGSLERLGLDYLDLFLIHWPMPEHDLYVETWQALIELQRRGKVKSIGVSNFLPNHLERIIEETGVTPAVNQIELHPYFQQLDVREFHRRHSIHIESYSPLGRGEELNDPLFKEIGDAHRKSPAQVIIRWHLQQGLVVIPKTKTPARVPENFDVFDFELTENEMGRIGALDKADGKNLPEPEEMNNRF